MSQGGVRGGRSLRRRPAGERARRPAPRQVRLPTRITRQRGRSWSVAGRLSALRGVWGHVESVVPHARHQNVRCPLWPSTHRHGCQHDHGVRHERVPVRAVLRGDLDDGHATTVPRGTDTTVALRYAAGERAGFALFTAATAHEVPTAVVRGPPLPLVPAHSTEQGHHHVLSMGHVRCRGPRNAAQTATSRPLRPGRRHVLVRQYVRCPLWPSTHRHGCQPTTTVPGPNGCPFGQCVGATSTTAMHSTVSRGTDSAALPLVRQRGRRLLNPQDGPHPRMVRAVRCSPEL
jgi:hypothetical protein